MTLKSNSIDAVVSSNNDYGFARVRDIAFDAVRKLWRRRQSEGMKQTDLAVKLGRDTAWVSRKLSAPGNWTLRTLGEFAHALDGEAKIEIVGLEDPLDLRSNYDAYEAHQGRIIIEGKTVIEVEPQFSSVIGSWDASKTKLEPSKATVRNIAVLEPHLEYQ